MTDWQPIKTTPKEQVLSAMELLLTAKQINYVKSKTFSGPSKIAVIRRLINIGIQIETTDEIERLREALVFYASFADALPHENIAPLMIDRGKKARAALKEGE